MLPRLELGLSPAAPKNGMAEDDGRSKRNDDEEDDSKSYSDMEVVAIVGLEVPSPWMVLPSKHYAGRQLASHPSSPPSFFVFCVCVVCCCFVYTTTQRDDHL